MKDPSWRAVRAWSHPTSHARYTYIHIGLRPPGGAPRVKVSFCCIPWSIDRQVSLAWPYLLPTPGATDGLLDRLPASLRVSAQASASSSGASRLWSRRARCLTTWTSRSRAAPERADHLWCAPLSCPSPSNMTAHLLALASRVGRDAQICSSRPLMRMSRRGRLDPLSGSWPPSTSSRLDLRGPRQSSRELVR